MIDDGWQKITGDWEENEKFGSMERVAEEIAKRGYVPGIWLAPFFVHENSDNYKKLCLVKNKSGETYRIACYGFADITDERTCQKVLDENDLPRVELVRSFLRQVKGINPELKVIACGCIPEGCAGIADINNQINGTFCSENAWLLTDVLRKEWGFDGIVMTDWGAVKDRVKGIVAGLDLEMPGDTYCTDEIVKAVREGRLEESALDECVMRMLAFVEKWHHGDKKACDFAAHHALAAEIAKDCAVLLKNEGVLPLDKEKKVLVAGEFFEKMRYQGAGSSMINPAYLTTPRDAFDEKGLPYAYAKGYREQSEAADETLIAEAVKGAKNYDTVLVFAGLSDYAESEGGDRPNMRLPENQLALIDALVAETKRSWWCCSADRPWKRLLRTKFPRSWKCIFPDRTAARPRRIFYTGTRTRAESWRKRGRRITPTCRTAGNLRAA